MEALVKTVSNFRAEVSDVPGCDAASLRERLPTFRRIVVPSSLSIKQ